MPERRPAGSGLLHYSVRRSVEVGILAHLLLRLAALSLIVQQLSSLAEVLPFDAGLGDVTRALSHWGVGTRELLPKQGA